MNYNKQNKKIQSITEKTLVIGIDVGSEVHYARAFDWRKVEFSKKPIAFHNDKEGFAEFLAWITAVKEKHGKEEVIAGLEPTGHYWFNLGKFLQDNKIKMVQVNPCSVKRSKELDDNSPSKNDRKDPKVIAGLVTDGRYLEPYIPDGIYAELRNFSNMEISAQKEMIKIKNSIQRWFSMYFPEYKKIYKQTITVSGMLILKNAPMPEDIVRLGVNGIVEIWKANKVRAVGKKKAEALVKAAENTVGIHGGKSARIQIANLIEDYEHYDKRTTELIEEMEALIKEIPYAEKITEIKGVGTKSVCRFIGEIGDIKRFSDPKQIQKLAGYEIVSCESGKQKGESHISYRGRKMLRYTLFEIALSLIGKNEEFKELHKYYTTRENNPLKKMQSTIVIACKFIRIAFAIATKGITYDGEKMLKDITRPMLEKAA